MSADPEITSAGDEAEARPKLTLDVKIDPRGACQRHVTVTVPRDDIDRYYNDAFTEMMPSAAIPGFRAGRAPRKLVEARYRRDLADQVKGSLIIDSMTQITEDHKLAAISEPDLDPVAIQIPDDGPMTFEFDLEVRPEFDLPNWKGLTIERPKRDFTDADVEDQLNKVLANHGRLVPKDGPAAAGDYISTNLTFRDGDNVISSSEEEVIRIRKVLSFRDGRVENFDKLMKGVKAGETREGKAKLSADAPKPELRGKDITAVFEVHEVKQLEMPELTPELLDRLGGFADEAALREAIRKQLELRLDYQQQQRARQQVLAALTVAADWDLPPELLKRQSSRELQRAVLELRRNGFSDTEIKAHENDIRQNSAASTARALKEHFILERIAEEEEIEDLADDYEAEIAMIAAQNGQSVRRVRAQIEKGGMMDALRNQIIERKVIDQILAHAKFKDVPYQIEGQETEALDQAVGGEESDEDIPEAKYADQPESTRPAAEPRG
jgi:trigger factor